MVYGKLSDPELAQRIASGDKDAFELLMAPAQSDPLPPQRAAS